MAEPTRIPARKDHSARVLGRRALWGAIDQAIFSLTSFALAVAVAHHATTAQFGAFGIVYVVYVLVLGGVEAFTAEVLVVRGAHLGKDVRRQMLASATGAAVACGGCLAVIGVLVALLVPGSIATVATPIFLLAPLLLVQDVWRFGFFVMDRNRAAAANDGLWAVLLAGAFAFEALTGTVDLVHLVWAWSVCGAVCGIVGAVQSRCVPTFTALVPWTREHGRTGGRFAGEYLSLYGAAQAVLIWVGVWTGFTQSAAFRGGQLLFGPIQLLLNSLRLAVTPIAVRAYRQRDLDAVRRFGVGISAGALLISLFWGGALVALPASAGHLILGRSWAAARSALIPFWCLTAGFAFGFGALVMLRAMAAIRTSFKIRLTSAVATFCIGGAAALGGSVPAATSGATVVTFTSLAMWRRAWQISNDERHSSRQTGGAAGDVHAESTAVGGDLPARPHGRHSPDPGPNAGQGGHIAPSGAGSS